MTANDSRAHNWQSIREWDGSQHRAFEELCFQLRKPAPPGWETIKTAAPDGGVEWYDQAPDGSAAHGFQVKFVHSIEDLIPQAKKSAATVGENIANRKIVRLEFLAPFDLSDPTPSPRAEGRAPARGSGGTKTSPSGRSSCPVSPTSISATSAVVNCWNG